MESTEEPAPGRHPWRGSSISYGLTSPTSRTIDRGFQLTYQPSLVHRLDLRPEWHFNEQLYLRGEVLFAQEFFTGNTTTYGHQIVWSDPTIDLGFTGVEDRYTHIRVSGSLQVAAGLSKAAILETRVASLAPGVSISRRFALLSGLQVGYNARLTQHFHRFTTGQNVGAAVPEMCPDDNVSCIFRSNGALNTHTDIAHGPVVTLSPTRRLSVSASFQMYRGWRYEPTKVDNDPVSYQPLVDPGTSDGWGFAASVSYDVLPFLNVSLNGNSFGPQLTADSQRENPLYNRYTQLSLDLGLDVEAFLQRI
ncbi:MAG: hypothetical protein IRZ16_17115 [Myxococcaceae bacterium]|nr:hypothetical protein [Myxococcaceae bacterium]